MIKILENKHSGFTLIEIILALVITALVGTGLAQYLGTAFSTSAIPIQHLRQAFKLQQVMENITEDYENDPTPLTELQGRINDNDYDNDNVNQHYTVEYNDFVKFDGTRNAVEDNTDPKNLLMVTIKNESGIITTLFTSQ